MSVQSVQTSRVSGGLCPHGMSPGACPICSGGGGGAAVKKADHTAKAGEMSWAECAAIGRMLRAQQMAKEMNNQAFENRLLAISQFQNNIANIAQSLSKVAMTMINDMPAIIAKPFALVVNKLAIPLLNVIKNLPVNIMKTLDNIKQQFTDIQDKLNAIFGELKNAMEKKISDNLSLLKKKLFSLFAIYEATDVDEEEKQVEEEKRTFEVKTFIHDIYNKITQTTQAYGELKRRREQDAD